MYKKVYCSIEMPRSKKLWGFSKSGYPVKINRLDLLVGVDGHCYDPKEVYWFKKN